MKVQRQPAPDNQSATSQNSRTWYLVANGQNALVFQGDGDGLKQIADITPAGEFTASNAQQTAGHQPGGEGSVYYTSDPKDRKDDHDEERFLTKVCEWLRSELEANHYETLIIAAAPNALGLLRNNLHHLVKDKIQQEIDKDYTNSPILEIEKALLQ